MDERHPDSLVSSYARATWHVAQLAVVLALAASVSGCGTVGAVKKTILGSDDDAGPKILAGFIGGVVADEPRAALAAKQVLAIGGNAADAAVTLGFMLSVTLPSRAALGGGGVCLAYDPRPASANHGVPEAISFVPPAPAQSGDSSPYGDRPAAVPTLARGLYLLSARYGSQNFAALVAPAEQAARDGFPVSRALARDLVEVAGPLIADPSAQAIFAPSGQPIGEGGQLVQTDLAGSLAQIRTVGVGDMYQGLLAHKLAEATARAGGPIGLDDLRFARAELLPAGTVAAGDVMIAFPPPPADGGPAAKAAFEVLQHDPSAFQAAAAQSVAAAAQARGQNPGALPASTSFVVVDRRGAAVACALSLNNLFGTGRIAPGTGILLAASPRAKPAPLLATALAWNPGQHEFRAAVGGSGQNGAALAAAIGMRQALAGSALQPVPDPGRVNVIACPRGLPGDPASCRFSADPRGAGLVAGGS